MPTQTFSYTGGLQSFTVPPCVASLTIRAIGARGGSSTGPGGESAGRGTAIQGDFPVTPGEELNILVGGAGTDSLFGGGGSFIW
ncbi:hypothetical protein [Brevibacillus sp. NRS-1366]|uniref:hypothetical protein n=1 Tax=Brevibacillus sp. NRS-1366 TaxID=3233899 RepID=UPI003D246A68